MNVKEALGLGSAGERLTVPAGTWVPVALGLVMLAVGILLGAGLSVESAVPIGFLVGAFLAVPVATLLTVRRARRTR